MPGTLAIHYRIRISKKPSPTFESLASFPSRCAVTYANIRYTQGAVRSNYKKAVVYHHIFLFLVRVDENLFFQSFD